MISPAASLAFSMHCNRGVYALLLGAELSRSAGVPDTREILLDLLRTLAAIEGEPAGGDLVATFRRRYGEALTSERLLSDLAGSEGERRQLMRSYIEPSETEREAGLKLPTAGHRAIAALVRDGLLRVIVTTVPDRLLETALRELSVEPTVVATADAAAGAPPLAHCQCLLVKLNGDYLGGEIRLVEERTPYPPAVAGLLDRVLDEYGLVVCGWSADLDLPLRAAIERCPSRRYRSYWVAAGEPGAAARDLIALRRADIVPADSPDGFLAALARDIAALQDTRPPHPLTVELAVARLKRFIAEPRHRVRLHDLVMREAQRVQGALAALPSDGEPAAPQRRQRIEAATAVLRRLMAHGAYWNEGRFNGLWSEALRFVAGAAEQSAAAPGSAARDLDTYAPMLLFYGAGLGAVAAADYVLLRTLAIGTRLLQPGPALVPAVRLLAAGVLDTADALQGQPAATAPAPLSQHLFELLRGEIGELAPGASGFADLFDRFETLLALCYLDQTYSNLGAGYLWMPPGRYAWRDGGDDPLARLSTEAELAGTAWPPLGGGLFGGSLQRFQRLTAAFGTVRGMWRSQGG